MDGESLQQKMTHRGRENNKLQDLQRQEGGGECFWNISGKVQGTTGHHGAKAELVRDIVFTCVVLLNLLRTHQGGATLANDVAAFQNEQVVYVPDDNYSNPSREDKHQHWLGKI